MAACSDTEEKPSSPNETLPLKISSENVVNHEMRKNCYNELSNVSKNNESFSQIAEKSNPDVNTLSEDEFLQLMIEASTFNKSSKQESALLKKLRIDNPITETEPSDKAKLRTNSQFPVHKNTRNYTGHNSFSSNSRTLDGRKKHSRNKDDSHAKSANVLQKGIHQSQSLQDLMSSDLTKSKQKSRKAHRTHSLSSDEVTGIDSDSLTILKKLGKKSSYKQLDSSKSDLNKTNYKTVDDDVPIHCAVKDGSVPARRNSAGESNSLPIEIEMEEIKSDKMSSQDDSSSGKEIEKSGVAQSNSKFYVDSNDIDSTVSFPLKLVSSIDDQNNEVGGDQLKRFPIVPWPRPLQVQSFFSSLPLNSDSFSANDKQILNADINGNPFTRNTRPSNLASFVSSTLMDYSNNGIVSSDTKNRKNKRLRNSVNKGVLAENIAGHRGEEDIDSLLQFINSSDKKAKSAVKGNSQNQIISAKSSLLHDNDRKKSLGKEFKNCQKNVINVVKKDLKRSSSLENISSSKVSNDVSDVFLFEPRVSASDLPIKDSKTVPSDTSTGKILDVNSNEENKLTQMKEKGRESSTSDSSLHNGGPCSSPEVSSFAADFYSTAEVSSQTIEEPGFLIVKKKQRKKHQSKRSESYRWRNAQTQRKKGMMLPLAESKCGKQDSRRKSTSSVPHSDHSSADNSDLDSVHSLPVRGSVPHPTQPHPHTTPSSSSSTPQASYADIARMPISKLNSPAPSIITYSAQASIKSPSERTDSAMSSAKDSVAAGMPQAKDAVSAKDGHVGVPSAKDTIADLPLAKDGFPGITSAKDAVTNLPLSKDDVASLPSAKDSVAALSAVKDDITCMPSAKDTVAGSSMSANKRRVPDVKVCSSGKEILPTMVIENDSDSNLDVKALSHAKSTREINTQTEPENVVVAMENKLDASAGKLCKKGEESSKAFCNTCSSRKSNCSCSKLHLGTRQKTKSTDIPPVIMDNMPPESNACNVSFGFGIEEVLEMDSSENTTFDLAQKNNRDIPSVRNAQRRGGEIVEKDDGIFEISSVHSKTNVGLCYKSSSSVQVASKPLHRPDLAHEQSSHLKKVRCGSGKNICYNETQVNVKRFNHSELTRYLKNEFLNVEKEVKGISKTSKASPKVEYYNDGS